MTADVAGVAIFKRKRVLPRRVSQSITVVTLATVQNVVLEHYFSYRNYESTYSNSVLFAILDHLHLNSKSNQQTLNHGL